MSRNLELKARIGDLSAAEDAARSLHCHDHFVLEQTDTYFFVRDGRLKLRESPQVGDELIYYRRADSPGFKSCHYWRRPIRAASAIRRALASTCGCETEVRKVRSVYLIDNIRIHLDDVAQLGGFLEFEAVLRTSAHQSSATEQLSRLSELFGIHAQDRVAGSYRELMLHLTSNS